MLLSAPTHPLYKYYDDKNIIRIFSKAGFDAYDSSFDCSMKTDGHPFTSENYLEYAKELRAFADELGIICNQAHAPFPSSCGDEEKDQEIFKNIVRSMEIASVLGAKIIVVHPKQHLEYADNAEKLFKMNVDFYNRLIPYCQKYNIKIAIENMWRRNSASGAITDSVCSRAWEFNRYIDAINSEWVTGCVDIGHVSLITNKIPEFIRDMGKDRIKALHIHDTDLLTDTHTMPFLEKLDYFEITKTLGEIGYDGDFTFEALNFYKSFPIELVDSATKLLHDVGRFLIAEIEKARKNK